MLQEGNVRQPIDYRDLCVGYTDPRQVDQFVSRLVRQVAHAMQTPLASAPEIQRSRLSRFDLGDPAAENEEHGLVSYFVPTAEASAALRGNARLVIGRKGTGKSAIFHYLLRRHSRGNSSLVLDLRPEGFQLRKLVDLLEISIGEGVREETLTAFWDYILLTELAAKIIDQEASLAHRDHDLLKKFELVRSGQPEPHSVTPRIFRAFDGPSASTRDQFFQGRSGGCRAGDRESGLDNENRPVA